MIELIKRLFIKKTDFHKENTSYSNDIQVDSLKDISEKYKKYEMETAEYDSTYYKDIDYSIDNSIIEYKTNFKDQICNCEDWQLKRSRYKFNDPRRFCKHIINLLDLENLSKELLFYKEKFEYYKNNEKGYESNFEDIIDVKNSHYKLAYNYNYDWMDLFEESGLRYGILFDEYDDFYWAKKYKKPKDYKDIELFMFDLLYGATCKLTNDEKHEINSHVNTNIIDFAIKERKSNYIIYCLNCDYEHVYDDAYKNYSTDELDFHNVVIDNHDIYVNLHGKNFILERDYKKNIIQFQTEKETQLNLIKENHELLDRLKIQEEMSLLEKNDEAEHMLKKGYVPSSFNDNELYEIDEFLTIRNSIFTQFIKVNELSKKLSISTRSINKALTSMKLLTKNEKYNMNNYILVNDGLRLGINFERNSEYSHISTPEWYITHHINKNDMLFEKKISNNNVKLTDVYYDSNKLDELSLIINEGIDKLEKQNEKQKNKTD